MKELIILGGMIMVILTVGCVQNTDEQQVIIQKEIGNYTPSVFTVPPQILTPFETGLSNIQENICKNFGAGFLCSSPENSNLQQYCEQGESWKCRDIYPDLPNMTFAQYESMTEKRTIIGGSSPSDRMYYFDGGSCLSMYPVITCDNEYIGTFPVNSYDIKTGEIIMFRYGINNEYSAIHRIVEIKSDTYGIYYVTKGDFNPNNDDFKVRPNQVILKIVGRYVG